jgi:hypothetical protein
MAMRHMRAMIDSVITTQPIHRPAANGFAQMNRSRSSRWLVCWTVGTRKQVQGLRSSARIQNPATRWINQGQDTCVRTERYTCIVFSHSRETSGYPLQSLPQSQLATRIQFNEKKETCFSLGFFLSAHAALLVRVSSVVYCIISSCNQCS